MPNTIKNTIRSLGALLLLIVFAQLGIFYIWFNHNHIDSHGNIYSHSHPYNKGQDESPVKHHNHSCCCLIDTSLHFNKGGEIYVPRAKTKTIVCHFGNLISHPVSCHISLASGRSPPTIQIFAKA
jgi:hypothetical protein